MSDFQDEELATSTCLRVNAVLPSHAKASSLQDLLHPLLIEPLLERHGCITEGSHILYEERHLREYKPARPGLTFQNLDEINAL